MIDDDRIIKFETHWLVNGNIFTKDFCKGDIEVAKQYAETLDNCFACVNCINCVNCNHCIACDNCRNCDYCQCCNQCYQCSYCTECNGCKDCKHCQRCNSCEECHHCFNCLHCNKCVYCYGCNECMECNFCSNCYMYSKSSNYSVPYNMQYTNTQPQPIPPFNFNSEHFRNAAINSDAINKMFICKEN